MTQQWQFPLCKHRVPMTEGVVYVGVAGPPDFSCDKCELEAEHAAHEQTRERAEKAERERDEASERFRLTDELLVCAEAERDEYRREWESACERLAADEPGRMAMAARIAELVAERDAHAATREELDKIHDLFRAEQVRAEKAERELNRLRGLLRVEQAEADRVQNKIDHLRTTVIDGEVVPIITDPLAAIVRLVAERDAARADAAALHAAIREIESFTSNLSLTERRPFVRVIEDVDKPHPGADLLV